MVLSLSLSLSDLACLGRRERQHAGINALECQCTVGNLARIDATTQAQCGLQVTAVGDREEGSEEGDGLQHFVRVVVGGDGLDCL